MVTVALCLLATLYLVWELVKTLIFDKDEDVNEENGGIPNGNEDKIMEKKHILGGSKKIRCPENLYPRILKEMANYLKKNY